MFALVLLFFLDKCYFDKFSLAGLLEEEALYLSLLYIHDLFFSKSTSGVIPSLLSNSIKLLMVIYISFNNFLELVLCSNHNQLSERKLIFQKVFKLEWLVALQCVCVGAQLVCLCLILVPQYKTLTNWTEPRQLSRWLPGVWGEDRENCAPSFCRGCLRRSQDA